MTTKYSAAELAARDAVIQALYDNVPQNTLCELWRHYLGLRCIAETTDQKTTLGTDNITFTSDVGEYPFGAAQPVGDVGLGGLAYASDTISFGDSGISLTL
tara:strand:- start:138 stop:440 length:303 start_codon:yes stop_codon:yes gene_type:complete